MKSEDLLRSPIWSRMACAIARDFRAGVPFEQIHEMNIAMKQGTLELYRKHRRALDALLWYDDPGPKKIIEARCGVRRHAILLARRLDRLQR